MKKLLGYVIVAAAGAGFIYVPSALFYDPDIFFICP